MRTYDNGVCCSKLLLFFLFFNNCDCVKAIVVCNFQLFKMHFVLHQYQLLFFKRTMDEGFIKTCQNEFHFCYNALMFLMLGQLWNSESLMWINITAIIIMYGGVLISTNPHLSRKSDDTQCYKYCTVSQRSNASPNYMTLWTAR